jgi:diadenylate cyclase
MTLPLPSVLVYVLGPDSTWRDVAIAALDGVVIAYLCYRVLLLIRGTRAINVLVGLFLLGVGYLAAQWANLVTLHWLLGHFLGYSFIFVIVLFQEDIRRGLAHLGRGRFLRFLLRDDGRERAGVVESVARAAAELAGARRGALIVVDRTADLGEVAETGVALDAELSAEMLVSLFQPGGPLHDGAVVLRRGRIAAARCLLPLSATPDLRDVGTRHRAALGLAEEVDAAVVVVSEERGEISVAVDGALHRALDEGALRQLLVRLLVPEPGKPAPRAWDPVRALLARSGARAAQRGRAEGGGAPVAAADAPSSPAAENDRAAV